MFLDRQDDAHELARRFEGRPLRDPRDLALIKLDQALAHLQHVGWSAE